MVNIRATDLDRGRGAAAAGAGSEPPSRSDALLAAWRAYFAHADQPPRHPAARDFMDRDLQTALARLIPADATVLEAGCGLGELVASLPNAVRKGIDFLPEMVAEARRRHPEIPFDVDDACAPDPVLGPGTQPRAWDAIVCDRLCHSVLDIRALLAGLRRRLAPGGRIYLTAFNYLWEVPTRLAELAGWKRPAPTSNWLSDSDFKNLFDLAGLEVVRYEDRLILPLDRPRRVVGAEPLSGAPPGVQPAVALPHLRAARSRDHGAAGAGVQRRAAPASPWWSRRATRPATFRQRSIARR